MDFKFFFSLFVANPFRIYFNEARMGESLPFKLDFFVFCFSGRIDFPNFLREISEKRYGFYTGFFGAPMVKNSLRNVNFSPYFVYCIRGANSPLFGGRGGEGCVVYTG